MSSEKKVIEFGNEGEGKYSCFSTFYDFKFTHKFVTKKGEIFEREFNSVEQGFQYLRFFKEVNNKIAYDATSNMLKTILNESSGLRVKKICDSSQFTDRQTGLTKSIKCRDDWEMPARENSMKLKYLFLYDLFKSRFSQDEKSLNVLISTGDFILQEKTCPENFHGKILMAIRKNLSQEE